MNVKSFLIRISTLILLLTFALGLCANAESMFEMADKDSNLSPAPIVHGDKVLFNIYAGFDDFSAHERAVVIGKRLEELAEAVKLTQDSLHIQIEESRRHIFYSDKLIMTIAEADTIALQGNTDEIARAYHSLISERFIPLFISYSFKDNIFSIIKTILFGRPGNRPRNRSFPPTGEAYEHAQTSRCKVQKRIFPGHSGAWIPHSHG